ncbi:MAG: FAD/NAD(P)-binding protein [Candidatus Marinimicrobia bacterium]|nr:FAD/NAD(P)-binding protein [Candidatus Neomarinimicrobiota bacterium]
MCEKNAFRTISATVTKLVEESPLIRTLRVEPEEEFVFHTGQFAELSVPNIGEGPFTPSSGQFDRDILEFTIMKAGFVTEHIHQLKVGDRIGLRGPFGTKYPIDEWYGKDVLILGGGVGLAPTRSLFLSLVHQIDKYKSITFLTGARTPGDMIYKDQVKEWNKIDKVNIISAVDKVPEGQEWDCEVCLITKLLDKVTIDPQESPAVVCGPPVMMKFGTIELLNHGFQESNIYLSMEKKMYCGHGQCRHCVMGKYYACKDGAVFTYDKIKNEENIWE